MDVSDLKEKALVLGFTSAIFLPIRLIVGQYLMNNWLGMLGVASIVSIVLIVLVKKDMLGSLGRIFKKQMTKSLWGRSAKFIILTLMVFSAYFGSTILLVEHANSQYSNDKQIIAQSFADKKFTKETLSKLQGPQIHDFGIGLAQIQQIEYFLAIAYAILNDSTNGWLVNMHFIMFVEQIEFLGLFWFYRQAFKPQMVPNQA
jgi:hypothetical protein